MAAALNGMAVSKVRPFGGTFFNFSDYMRPSIRLAALMEIPTIYIFTHDSIGLGEDGPTHQPIEQLASLRAMPGLMLLRPADANEVVEAWKVIMQLQHEPAALVLSRQAVPTFDRSKYGPAAGVAKGAYILADAADGKPEVILMGTGSEVSLCVSAYEQLQSRGRQGPRGQHAVVESFRAAERRVQSQGSAARGESAGRGGAGLHVRLVAICWPSRHQSSGCAGSALPRRSRICRRSSGSPRRTWSRRPEKHWGNKQSSVVGRPVFRKVRIKVLLKTDDRRLTD